MHPPGRRPRREGGERAGWPGLTGAGTGRGRGGPSGPGRPGVAHWCGDSAGAGARPGRGVGWDSSPRPRSSPGKDRKEPVPLAPRSFRIGPPRPSHQAGAEPLPPLRTPRPACLSKRRRGQLAPGDLVLFVPAVGRDRSQNDGRWVTGHEPNDNCKETFLGYIFYELYPARATECGH